MIVKTGCGTDGALHSTNYFSLDFQFHEFHVCRLEELERQSKGSGSVTSSGSESSRSFSLKSTQSVGAPEAFLVLLPIFSGCTNNL